MKLEITDYLRTLDRSDNTRRTYTWALSYFAQVVGKDASLDTDTYIRFLKSLRSLSPSTKTVCKTAVMGLYAFCEAGDLAKMLKANGHYIARAHINPVEFDRPAVEKVIAFCATLRDGLLDLRDRAFVLTMADSGMRISEICSLKRGAVDFLEGRATVTGKRNKRGVVRFSKRSLASIKDYLSARAKLDGASGKPLASLPLFASHDKRGSKHIRRVGIAGMRKAIKARMKEAGIDPTAVRIHDFRHFFVTITMIESGGNLKLAQELARHDSVTTTQRYAHFADSELDRSYDEIFNREK